MKMSHSAEDEQQYAPPPLLPLCQNHPFVDGNKRTAVTATGLFLIQNGCQIDTSNDELENFTLRVANNHTTLDEIEIWLRENTACG